MKRPSVAFNLFFISVLASVVAGCSTSEAGKDRKNKGATLRLHFESVESGSGRTQEISVPRSRPQTVRVTRAPFLDEGYVVGASVLRQADGGHTLAIRFDDQGSFRLQQYTTAHKGYLLVVGSQFPEHRWLAAIKIREPIENGVLMFVPDATAEEAQGIADGLNALAKKLGNAKK